MKKIKYPIHKMGKKTGFDEHEDGAIEIAPLYSKRFDELMEEEDAVSRLLEKIVDHCNFIQIKIAKKRKLLWDDLADDYGLNIQRPYNYNRINRTLTIIEPEAK